MRKEEVACVSFVITLLILSIIPQGLSYRWDFMNIGIVIEPDGHYEVHEDLDFNESIIVWFTTLFRGNLVSFICDNDTYNLWKIGEYTVESEFIYELRNSESGSFTFSVPYADTWHVVFFNNNTMYRDLDGVVEFPSLLPNASIAVMTLDEDMSGYNTWKRTKYLQKYTTVTYDIKSVGGAINSAPSLIFYLEGPDGSRYGEVELITDSEPTHLEFTLIEEGYYDMWIDDPHTGQQATLRGQIQFYTPLNITLVNTTSTTSSSTQHNALDTTAIFIFSSIGMIAMLTFVVFFLRRR